MEGWRKLTAWLLVHLLTVYTMWEDRDMHPHSSKMLTYVTIAFFVTNSLQPLFQAIGHAVALRHHHETKKKGPDSHPTPKAARPDESPPD